MSKEFFSSKRVLVTGGCGTVGKELVSQLVHDYAVQELVVIDNNSSDGSKLRKTPSSVSTSLQRSIYAAEKSS